jgi:hypothetical protein
MRCAPLPLAVHDLAHRQGKALLLGQQLTPNANRATGHKHNILALLPQAANLQMIEPVTPTLKIAHASEIAPSFVCDTIFLVRSIAGVKHNNYDIAHRGIELHTLTCSTILASRTSEG